MELLIVRHGRPERDERKPGEGPADPSLSPLGLKQAELVADALAIDGVDHVVASSMARAHQTAEPLALRLGRQIELSDDLRESDHGASAYVPVEEMDPDSPFVRAYREDPMKAIFRHDYSGFRDRVVRGFDEIIDANQGRTVAVFCHGMVTAVFLQVVAGMSSPLGLRIDYAGISRVQASRDGRRTIRSVNETAHVRHLLDSPSW